MVQQCKIYVQIRKIMSKSVKIDSLNAFYILLTGINFLPFQEAGTTTETAALYQFHLFHLGVLLLKLNGIFDAKLIDISIK